MVSEILLALAGRVVVGERVIDLPPIADWPNRPRQMADHAIGKPSRTRLRVVRYELALDAARVDLFPETGRSRPSPARCASCCTRRFSGLTAAATSLGVLASRFRLERFPVTPFPRAARG